MPYARFEERNSLVKFHNKDINDRTYWEAYFRGYASNNNELQEERRERFRREAEQEWNDKREEEKQRRKAELAFMKARNNRKAEYRKELEELDKPVMECMHDWYDEYMSDDDMKDENGFHYTICMHCETRIDGGYTTRESLINNRKEEIANVLLHL